MPGDPADVGRTPENVIVAIVENPLECFFSKQIVSGGGVADALGFTGGTAGVKNEQGGFAFQRLGRAIG